MFCQKCGAANKEDAVFCTKCGESLTVAEALSSGKAAPAKKKKYKKNLGLPFAALLIGVGGWLYGLLAQSEFLMTIYNELTGSTASLGDGSGYEALNGVVSGQVLYIVGAVAVLLTVIGVAGLISLLSHLWNRLAHKDD